MSTGFGDMYMGIMTGTSLDGVDCVLATFDQKPNCIQFYTRSLPSEFHDQLFEFATSETVSVEKLVRMHFVISQLYAEAVRDCLALAGIDAANVRAIGLHGQTIRHLPKKVFFHADFAPVGATFQLGSGPALAALTGIDVVHDFRAADVALGGEGAPLVPMFDKRFFYDPDHDRLTLNIGGIANVTYLPRWELGILAFDTGPGNMIIDGLARRYFNTAFDEGGAIASQGNVQEALLAQLLSHHYFAAPPPKSTGRELFGDEFLKVFLDRIEAGTLEPGDAVRTATELTASSIAVGIRALHPALETLEVIVSGGGAKNNFLMRRLTELLSPATIQEADAFGISSRSKEALAFAYFAKAFLDGDHIHIPQTTGASRTILLGSLSKGT